MVKEQNYINYNTHFLRCESGGDVEDAGEDETVGDKDGDAGHKDVDAPHNEHHQLIDVRAGARELEHREDVTEIMVDGVGITEDLCYSSVIIPKMLVNFVSEKNFTSFPECMTQLFFFCFLVIDESYMLAAMAYDRYAAIYNPLLYNVTMSERVCFQLVASVYTVGIFGASIHTGYISRCLYCGTNVIHHYFCDILPLLTISCSRDYSKERLLMVLVGVNVFACAFAIFISYTFILINILFIRSAEGRSKAFSTCSSHLAAVCVFYGSIIFMYFKTSKSDTKQEKVASVFYTTVIPMLNPLIYSLRNKDVKESLKKVLKGGKLSGSM
ncbi:Olfactory Receptor 8D2 [Manis pentadactyla]|nr:Olfactory Receptor 8D2 [Manis pentadactyla]